jgi:hypothetical protein
VLAVVVPQDSHLEIEAMPVERRRRFHSRGTGRRDQGPYLQLHALWGDPWQSAERLARYDRARRSGRRRAQDPCPVARGRTISSTRLGYRSTSIS